MNLSKLWQLIFVGVCVGSFICGDANGQGNGTGTTGSTAGNGLGTGSAGVMTGGGPDTSATASPYQQTVTETTSKTIVTTDQTLGAKKSAKVRKRSKKSTSKNSTTRDAPAATATATPSAR